MRARALFRTCSRGRLGVFTGLGLGMCALQCVRDSAKTDQMASPSPPFDQTRTSGHGRDRLQAIVSTPSCRGVSAHLGPSPQGAPSQGTFGTSPTLFPLVKANGGGPRESATKFTVGGYRDLLEPLPPRSLLPRAVAGAHLQQDGFCPGVCGTCSYGVWPNTCPNTCVLRLRFQSASVPMLSQA